MVFRIIKANQIKKSEVPYLVDTGQSIEGAKVPELDPNEDAFASEAFDMLSPEDLAGNGEKIQGCRSSLTGRELRPIDFRGKR